MATAPAYYNYGRFVADCPQPGCTDARAVYHPQTGARQTEDVCAKGHRYQIDMPPPDLEAQIVAAVAARPEDADKAWYPRGHTRALLAGLPTGQSVDDLIRENEEVARFRADFDRARRARLAELLAEQGIEVMVNDDGTFEGKI